MRRFNESRKLMTQVNQYPIGSPGAKWGTTEKRQWFDLQTIKRSYLEEVVTKINALSEQFLVKQYGSLSENKEQYPLLLLESKNFDAGKPVVVVTGGVHGYETSGVHGALLFAERFAKDFSDKVNFVIAPCVSPWGYETINRWNPKAIDPNRSFYQDSPAEESSALMAAISEYGDSIIAHFDLHETTDTDNSEFRPALAARDATVHSNWNIPDGFYLVGDSEKPEPELQKAIIQAVEKVTHIAPADDNGQLIGVKLEQFGVINYAAKSLGLCMGMTNAPFVTTTEVYPDSPLVDDENCNRAQAEVVISGLNYIISTKQLTIAK